MEDPDGLWRQEAFHALSELTDWGVLVIDTDHRVVAVNARACAFLGLSMANLLGRLTTDFFPDSRLVEVLRSGRPEYRRRAVRNGKPLIVTRLPLTQRGQSLGAIAVFQEETAFLAQGPSPVPPTSPPQGFSDLVWQSEIMRRLLATAKSYAVSDAPLLLTGESGTGKSQLARDIHGYGPRREEPFVRVPCAALGPETDWLGSEGIFAQAQSGTLLLDHADALQPAVQARLLESLEAPRPPRLIATAVRDLGALAQEGVFLPELLFRLSVLSLRVPPLRERRGDVPLLASAFFRQNAFPLYAQNQELIGRILDGLEGYAFPGNVRELFNLLERLHLLLAQGLAPSEPEVLLEMLLDSPLPPRPVGSTLEKEEQETIVRLLLAYHGDKARVARELGVSPTTLWRRMKEYGIR